MVQENIILATLSKHKDLLKQYCVKRIGVFGSHARQTAHVDSDIDLLVEFETPSFDNFMDLTFSLEEIFQRKVDLITSRSLSPYIKPYVDKEIHWYEG
jgi:uncharacterized protein